MPDNTGSGFDEMDGRLHDTPDGADEDQGPLCTYVIVASQDKLLMNVTPQAISVLTDVTKVNNIYITLSPLQTTLV